MGERALTKIQWGKETPASRGTPVAADTKILNGAHPPIPPDRVPEMIMDDDGTRAEGTRQRTDQFLVEDTLPIANTYFQVLPLLFSMGIKGNVTPAEQTSGEGDYLWTFTPSLTASNSPDSGTIELGDDTQAYEAEYMMIKRYRWAFTVAQGAESSPVTLDNEYFARQHTPTTFTAAIATPTVTNINGKLTRFYLDTTWAGVGVTEKTGLLRGGEIDLTTGLHPKFHGGANQYFDTHGEGKFVGTARFTLEGNSDADAIYDAFRAETYQVLSLNTSGAQIGAGDNHNVTWNLGGRWMDVRPLAENNQGNNLHTALFRIQEDLSTSSLFQLLVTTNVSAI